MAKVVFLHPDLGIGGAERAVIDAALALKSRGHSVEFVTAHHDQGHCFQETKDGTLKVTAVGDWLPRSFFGKVYALCAYIRMIYAAIYLVCFSAINFDVIFCDQISACIPFLRMSKAKIIFYCHFPDMLLTKRENFWKKLYRTPLDWLEEKTTGMAHCILVNSKFTADVFRTTFHSLSDHIPDVLYPIPDFSSFDLPVDEQSDDLIPKQKKPIFLSINRYERKKNLELSLHALSHLKEILSETEKDSVHMIVAGGYDERVTENKEYYLELRHLCDQLQLNENLTFLRSFSDAQKRTLLHYCDCLIYTPDREHFGIVPIEAMYMKCPVIAVNSGGPLETVIDGRTGFLCEGTKEGFAAAMERIAAEKGLAEKLGVAARKHVVEKFSFDAFTEQLESVVNKLLNT